MDMVALHSVDSYSKEIVDEAVTYLKTNTSVVIPLNNFYGKVYAYCELVVGRKISFAVTLDDRGLSYGIVSNY
jgi:hypothetical protein